MKGFDCERVCVRDSESGADEAEAGPDAFLSFCDSAARSESESESVGTRLAPDGH